MRPRESLVVWNEFDVWTNTDPTIKLKPMGCDRLLTGYYLLVPVASEKEGLELAKRIATPSIADRASVTK